MEALCSIQSHIASFYDVVHLWTINLVLYLDIHIQIRVPPNIDLIVDAFYFSNVGYYQSSTVPIIHNCFRQNSVHLRLPNINFTFNTAVVMAVRAAQNFKWSTI